MKLSALLLSSAVFLMLFLSETQAASRTATFVQGVENQQISNFNHFQKEDKKWRGWDWLRDKFEKPRKPKKSKSWFGLWALGVLIFGILLMLALRKLIIVGFLASAILAIFGLSKDENKILAVLALLLSLGSFSWLMIAIYNSFD